MQNKIDVLAVDDEEFNLNIMQEYFVESNISAYMAHNGEEALSILKQGNHVDVIVLDRMMPKMDGMEFLKIIKKDKSFRDLPVIMQTAATTTEQVKQGIEAGVFYYLSKPYSGEILLSLIQAANEDYKRKLNLNEQLREYGKAMSMVTKAEFKFQTLSEAKALSILVSSSIPNGETIMVGLTELMLNAVEHGNLGITYQEKTQLKLSSTWEEEVERRLHLPENSRKLGQIKIEKLAGELIINIKDEGAGFDWKQYLDFDSRRLTDPNGRGILFSLNCGMQVNFLGKGNEVECRVPIKQD